MRLSGLPQGYLGIMSYGCLAPYGFLNTVLEMYVGSI